MDWERQTHYCRKKRDKITVGMSGTHSVVVEQSGEMWRFQAMQDLHKLSTVDSINGREAATWKDALLKKLSDHAILLTRWTKHRKREREERERERERERGREREKRRERERERERAPQTIKVGNLRHEATGQTRVVQLNIIVNGSACGMA